MKCVLANSGIHVRPNGDITMCCDQSSLGLNAKDTTIQQAFSSEKFKQVRKDLSNGIQHESCNICWRSESQNLDSPRTRFNRLHQDSDKLSHWDIRDDNLCNMSCRICGPYSSSMWNSEALKYKQDSTYYHLPISDSIVESTTTNTIEAFKENLQHCKSVYFAGGEPLLNDTHWKILEILHENKMWDVHVRYNTNLMKTKYKGMDALEMWKPFRRLSVSVSVDAVGQLAEYARTGTVWSTLENNIKTLAQYHKLQANITTSIITLHELDKTIQHLQDIGVADVYYFNVLHTPKFMNINLLPTSCKQQLLDDLNLQRFSNVHGYEHLKNVLFSEQENKQDIIGQFKWYNEKLDKVRNTDLRVANPQLWKLLYETDKV